jgi:hypothetical protein
VSLRGNGRFQWRQETEEDVEGGSWCKSDRIGEMFLRCTFPPPLGYCFCDQLRSTDVSRLLLLLVIDAA